MATETLLPRADENMAAKYLAETLKWLPMREAMMELGRIAEKTRLGMDEVAIQAGASAVLDVLGPALVRVLHAYKHELGSKAHFPEAAEEEILDEAEAALRVFGINEDPAAFAPWNRATAAYVAAERKK